MDCCRKQSDRMGSRGDFVMAMFCGSHLIVYGKGEDVGSPLDIFPCHNITTPLLPLKVLKRVVQQLESV